MVTGAGASRAADSSGLNRVAKQSEGHASRSLYARGSDEATNMGGGQAVWMDDSVSKVSQAKKYK